MEISTPNFPYWRATFKNAETGRSITLRATGESREQAIDQADREIKDLGHMRWVCIEAELVSPESRS
ncbi:protein of unknown function [Burkholderia multivorans]